MLRYNPALKERARRLRSEMTAGEQALWSRLRLKQVMGVQVYRQKPIGNYVVDFYAPKVCLVVEVDGAQHLDGHYLRKDAQRGAYLESLGLKVLRFGNLEVLKEPDAVVEVIFQAIAEYLAGNPPNPLYERGAKSTMELCVLTEDSPLL